MPISTGGWHGAINAQRQSCFTVPAGVRRVIKEITATLENGQASGNAGRVGYGSHPNIDMAWISDIPTYGNGEARRAHNLVLYPGESFQTITGGSTVYLTVSWIDFPTSVTGFGTQVSPVEPGPWRSGPGGGSGGAFQNIFTAPYNGYVAEVREIILINGNSVSTSAQTLLIGQARLFSDDSMAAYECRVLPMQTILRPGEQIVHTGANSDARVTVSGFHLPMRGA